MVPWHGMRLHRNLEEIARRLDPAYVIGMVMGQPDGPELEPEPPA